MAASDPPLHGGGRAGDKATVDVLFSRRSPFWDEIYGQEDAYAAVHQLRQRLALQWLHDSGMGPGVRLLEVGCGAGHLAVELARRGFTVVATDRVPAMLEVAARNARAAGVADAVTFAEADAAALDHPNSSFDVVVALGVIPWLPAPERALREWARVLSPGGILLVNADNEARLCWAFDPFRSPRLRGVRRALKPLRRSRRVAPPSWLHSMAGFHTLLATAGFQVLRSRTFGYGPFTLLGRPVLSAAAGRRLHERLQARADRGSRWLAATGSQYLVVARKLP